MRGRGEAHHHLGAGGDPEPTDFRVDPDDSGVAARVLPFRRPSRAVDRLCEVVRECIVEGGFDEVTADDLLATIHFLVGGWLLGQRPNLPARNITPALVERAVRWALSGARKDAEGNS